MRLILILSVLGAGAAIAEPEPRASEPPDPGVLSGPKVRETAGERSLIRRDFQGRVRRLEIPAEEAAVELLRLDEPTKAKAQKILDERTAILDKAVRENIDLLLRLQNADRRTRLEFIREFGESLKELRARGTLREEIRAILPKDQAARYDELIDGYWEVVVADATQAAQRENGARPAPARAEVLAREVLAALGSEIRRSFERQIGQRARELEELLGKLGLSEEKDAKIRGILAEYAERTGGKPTPQQKRDLVLRIYRELDRDQQRIAARELLGLGEQKRGGEPESEPMMREGSEPMAEEPMKGDPK